MVGSIINGVANAQPEDHCVKNSIQFNGGSYHTYRGGYREFNYGLGFQTIRGCGPVAHGFSGGYYRNSFDRDSFYGLVTQYHSWIGGRLGPLQITPFLAAGAISGYPRWVGPWKGSVKPGAFVGASVEHSSGWGGNLSVVPAQYPVFMFNITKDF